MTDIFFKRRISLATLRYILISVALISGLLYAYTAHLPAGSWVSQVSADKHSSLDNWTVNDPMDYHQNIIRTSVENQSYNEESVTGTLPDREADSRSLERVPDMCVGSNKRLREVEDLLCKPRPKYLPDLKNPCWWEDSSMDTEGEGQDNFQLNFSSRRMRCLPYFHILCCSKSGTTDLYRRISLHPDIVPNSGTFGKEQLFWGWYFYGYLGKWEKGRPKYFEEYVDSFNTIASYLNSKTVSPEQKTHLVTLDGSPLDMWELRGWPKLPQNRGLREPQVLTPHLMRHLYRDPKFIVLMRDPVERLYTAFLFHRMGDNPFSFHSAVQRAIAMFDTCLSQATSRRQCYFNGSVTERLPADIHFICYAVYLKEWLAVFPWKHFLFMRTEDYSKNVTSSLLEVFRFLDLPEPDDETLERMKQLPVAHHTQQKDAAGDMLPETRALLTQYVQPCNAELADLLNHHKYTWKDSNPQTSQQQQH